MKSWSSRRKFVYGSITIIALILIVGIPAFLFFYKAPSCFDNVMNGDEFGIDCGGSCARLCQSSFLAPRIAWGSAKFEKVVDGYYNASSYIINQNLKGAALNVPYKISLYDDRGILIVERKGRVNLYAGRNSLAFESALETGKRIPATATFEFLQAPVWFKSTDDLEGLTIVDKKYYEDDNNSSLQVKLQNTTLYPYQNMIVSALLLDANGNVIGFSQTNVDSIAPKNGQEIAGFTWPVGRKGKVVSIEILPLITPIQDR